MSQLAPAAEYTFSLPLLMMERTPEQWADSRSVGYEIVSRSNYSLSDILLRLTKS